MQLSEGIVIAQRFRLVRPLGQGGMGAVWRAHHLTLDIPCAVKFMLGEAAASTDIRTRFEREARAAAQFKSPHVVQTLDHGMHEGMPYIAMELLEGEDLEHRLRRLGRVEPRDLVTVTIQVARALTRAHAAGLVHRDLKPANIFLTRDGDDEIVKILDFGVAKQAMPGVDSNTKSGALLGTPYYMSPEQARGLKAIDHRSDLWSLAVVVYQCLTGQLPFRSDAFGDLLVCIMFNPLPVPSQVAAVPPGFDAWWARAAAREPEARFQSAKELAEALIAVVDASDGGSAGVAAPPRANMHSAGDTTAPAPAPAQGSGASWGGSNPAASGLVVSAPGALATAPPARRTGLVVAAGFVVVGIAGGAAALVAMRGGEAAVVREPSASTATTMPAIPQPPEVMAFAEAPEVLPATPQHSGVSSTIAASPSSSAVSAPPRVRPGKTPLFGSSKAAGKPPKHESGI